MRDSNTNYEPVTEESSPDDSAPKFGLVDVIEAFTALRHECRGQIKEGRALTDTIAEAATSLRDLETKLVAAGSKLGDAKPLAELVADTDTQLARAVEAISKSETAERSRERADWDAIESCLASMNPLARWFAAPLRKLLIDQHEARDEPSVGAPSEGLNLLLARHRQAMRALEIERIDVLGLPFDGEWMNAIGAVESQDYPAGVVAEQLTPAYRWRGQLLRFADVRVSS